MIRFLVAVTVATVLMGALNGMFNPNAPEWSPETIAEGEISVEDAIAMSADALWIDARSTDVYIEGHISGAVNLNEDQWDGQLIEVLTSWDPGQTVIVYCSSRECQASHAVAERLIREMGMDPVLVLHGGWEVWEQAGR